MTRCAHSRRADSNGMLAMQVRNEEFVNCIPFTSLLVISGSLYGQWLQYATPGIPRTPDGKPNLTAPTPRAADGKPDLSGLWNMANSAGDLEGVEIQPWAQALLDERVENFGKDAPRYKCLPEGTLRITNGGQKMIVQNPALIVMLSEDLTYRRIFMDGRKLENNPNPSWMGYSVGHWDGDALVVESNGFNDRSWLDIRGHPHTEALRLTERYRRKDFGHIDVKVTVEDPAVYSKPWTMPLEGQLAVDTEMLESVCNENGTGTEHWVGNASDAGKVAVSVNADTLAKYVGVYKGMWGRRPRTIEITFKNGALMVSADGEQPWPMAAMSNDHFVGYGLGYKFLVAANGIATHVIEEHASGDYRYEKQK